jgi:putative ABC transport system substrate-binding protein
MNPLWIFDFGFWTSGSKRVLAVLVPLCAMLFAFGATAEAQQRDQLARIGYISGSSAKGAARGVEGFRQGLRDIGYVEGKNIVVEYRYGGGNVERIPLLVAELLKQNLNLLVTSNMLAIRAAKKATQNVPIVIITTTDPVAAGVVQSLARPGGNITGITRLNSELSDKRLEFLKDVVPTIRRVGVLLSIDRTRGADLKEFQSAAEALKMQLHALVVEGPKPDLAGAFQTAVRVHADALITGRGPVLNNFKGQIAELAIQHRLPLMSEGNDFVEAGALASYSANEVESFRRAAVYVARILKGAKPADLPIEQPTKFEFIINLRTAKQIGLTIPPNILARADRVIR